MTDERRVLYVVVQSGEDLAQAVRDRIPVIIFEGMVEIRTSEKMPRPPVPAAPTDINEAELEKPAATLRTNEFVRTRAGRVSKPS